MIGGGWRGGEGGGSNVVLSARGFAGITSCSVGNCIVTSNLMPGCCIKYFLHCPDMLMARISNSITILFTNFFDLFFHAVSDE